MDRAAHLDVETAKLGAAPEDAARLLDKFGKCILDVAVTEGCQATKRVSDDPYTILELAAAMLASEASCPAQGGASGTTLTFALEEAVRGDVAGTEGTAGVCVSLCKTASGSGTH